MNKKRIFALLTITVISVGLLATRTHPTTNGQTSGQNQPGSTAGTLEFPRPGRAPEHVVYRSFFHHLMALKDRATEIERTGGNGSGFRAYYENKVKLNTEQGRALDQIAADCEREVAVLDAKAKIIITAFRASALAKNSVTSGTLPALPPELKTMQQQRDMIILRARQKLRTALGEEAFQQLDGFIKVDAERNARPAELQPAAP
jgi:hypothetical protein